MSGHSACCVRIKPFTPRVSGKARGVNFSDTLFYATYYRYFDVLLTVHLSIFISVFNQLDAQNLFHNKFYFMPLHVSSTCARNV